jgi:hypothetical protein
MTWSKVTKVYSVQYTQSQDEAKKSQKDQKVLPVNVRQKKSMVKINNDKVISTETA